MPDRARLDSLARIVAAAGRVLMASSRRAGLAAKSDGSPVTDADLACEKALTAALAEAWPELTVIGEESAPPDGRLPAAETVALVDPLDGTRAYIDGGDDFCVCLGIVEKGEPVMGVIGAPARGVIYAGLAGAGPPLAWRAAVEPDGEIAETRTPIAARPAHDPPVGLVSNRHGDEKSLALLDRVGARERISLSSALKFAILAEGGADIYPRAAATMAWDTAAGQAILRAAGGATLDLMGRPLSYRPGAPLRNAGFVALGDPLLIPAAFG